LRHGHKAPSGHHRPFNEKPACPKYGHIGSAMHGNGFKKPYSSGVENRHTRRQDKAKIGDSIQIPFKYHYFRDHAMVS
jgi:hypothetical protein